MKRSNLNSKIIIITIIILGSTLIIEGLYASKSVKYPVKGTAKPIKIRCFTNSCDLWISYEVSDSTYKEWIPIYNTMSRNISDEDILKMKSIKIIYDSLNPSIVNDNESYF